MLICNIIWSFLAYFCAFAHNSTCRGLSPCLSSLPETSGIWVPPNPKKKNDGQPNNQVTIGTCPIAPQDFLSALLVNCIIFTASK